MDKINFDFKGYLGRLIKRTIAFIIVLVSVNAASVIVLSLNLRAEVYPINADSIGIPMGWIEKALWKISIPLAVGAIFTALPVLKTRIFKIIGYLFYGLAALGAIIFGLIWTDPRHYFIMAAFFLIPLAILLIEKHQFFKDSSSLI